MSPDVDPFRCSEPSNDGDHCDMQPNHGGLMHTGVRSGRRIWWDAETGERVQFQPIGTTRWIEASDGGELAMCLRCLTMQNKRIGSAECDRCIAEREADES